MTRLRYWLDTGHIRQPMFTVISGGQIDVQSVDIIHRTRRSVVIEAETKQKYAEVLGYGGSGLHLVASTVTRPESYDASAPATTIMFPDRFRGWDVLPEFRGRYAIRFALYKPDRYRSGGHMTTQTEDWRVRRITGKETS